MVGGTELKRKPPVKVKKKLKKQRKKSWQTLTLNEAQLEESGCFHSLAAAPGADSPALRYSNLDVWESCWEQPAPTGGTRGTLWHVNSLTGTPRVSEEPGTQPPRSISLLRSPLVPRCGEQPQRARPEPTLGHRHHHGPAAGADQTQPWQPLIPPR